MENILYISGIVAQGTDGKIIKGGIIEESHFVFKSMGEILAHFDLGYEDVVKCLVMIDDIGEWPDFNSVYIQYFENHILQGGIWCRWPGFRGIFRIGVFGLFQRLRDFNLSKCNV